MQLEPVEEVYVGDGGGDGEQRVCPHDLTLVDQGRVLLQRTVASLYLDKVGILPMTYFMSFRIPGYILDLKRLKVAYKSYYNYTLKIQYNNSNACFYLS